MGVRMARVAFGVSPDAWDGVCAGAGWGSDGVSVGGRGVDGVAGHTVHPVLLLETLRSLPNAQNNVG